MKLESIEAVVVRDTMHRLKLEQMEGSSNNRGEFWITESGYPYFLPYFKINDPDRFVKQSYIEVCEMILDY